MPSMMASLARPGVGGGREWKTSSTRMSRTDNTWARLWAGATRKPSPRLLASQLCRACHVARRQADAGPSPHPPSSGHPAIVHEGWCRVAPIPGMPTAELLAEHQLGPVEALLRPNGKGFHNRPSLGSGTRTHVVRCHAACHAHVVLLGATPCVMRMSCVRPFSRQASLPW